MSLRAAPIIVAAVLLLSGCTEPVPTSGIEGRVWLGPTCPVVRDPPDPDCEDRPYGTRLQAFRSGAEARAAEFESDSEGRFRVAVAPGTYEIRRAPDDKPFPQCTTSEPVIVEQGAYSMVRVDCDTGIR